MPNAGLDDVYRSFFKEELSINITNAENTSPINSVKVEKLRNYLRKILKTHNLFEKSLWLKKSFGYLRYNTSQSVCRFGIILSSHDTIPDPDYNGLMKIGMPGVSPYLSLRKWTSISVKSIEHIAPQKNRSKEWDQALYDDNGKYHSIGNLTLLPSKINSSAGNKGWKEKYLYYRHLSLKDPDKLKEFEKIAQREEISLNEDSIKLLTDALYSDHIESIADLGIEGKWTSELVDKRSKKILSIIWDRIIDWI